jgi:adenylosuccinate lyase
MQLNVLSERYATPEINEIFSEIGKNKAERELWVAVMEVQRELGLNIPEEDITAYKSAVNDIDLELIKKIEKTTKHDVKAKIEAFIQAASKKASKQVGQHVHKGMTSRDLTDNVEQMQYRNAANIILGRGVSVLRHMLDNSQSYAEYILTARTHNQPAQPTLLGKRFSMWAEEMLEHLESFEDFIGKYPLRGMKGAVGTQFDQMVLFDGNIRKVEALERKVAEKLGFKNILSSTGQVYPRSLDYAMVNNLAQISSAPANFAQTMKIMAGFGLVNEGFEEGQTGSSAMPYKMNTRSCERIRGFANLIKMYADGASRLSGEQWQEGDVECSVQRRIIMPDSFYTVDGLFETTLTVLKNMHAYEGEIVQELNKFLPFMATTELLQMAVKKGVGREDAHKTIKRCALAESNRMKEEGSSVNNLPQLLASDPLFAGVGITFEDIQKNLQDKLHFVGNAYDQIKYVSDKAAPLLDRYKEAANYEPRQIL